KRISRWEDPASRSVHGSQIQCSPARPGASDISKANERSAMFGTIYLTCALAGGTLLVCQVLLGVLGFGHHDADSDTDADHDVHTDGDHDTHHEHGHHESHGAWYLRFLTFRSVAAALTFFGLAGLAATENLGLDPLVSLVLAVAAAAAAFFGVAYLMRML